MRKGTGLLGSKYDVKLWNTTKVWQSNSFSFNQISFKNLPPVNKYHVILLTSDANLTPVGQDSRKAPNAYKLSLSQRDDVVYQSIPLSAFRSVELAIAVGASAGTKIASQNLCLCNCLGVRMLLSLHVIWVRAKLRNKNSVMKGTSSTKYPASKFQKERECQSGKIKSQSTDVCSGCFCQLDWYYKDIIKMCFS